MGSRWRRTNCRRGGELGLVLDEADVIDLQVLMALGVLVLVIREQGREPLLHPQLPPHLGEVVQVHVGGAIVLPWHLVVRWRCRGSVAQEQLVDSEWDQLVLGDILDPDRSVVDDVGGLGK